MIVMVEKSPGEIGKLFEIINDLIRERVSTIIPLRLKLESTYNAYLAEMMSTINIEELTEILDELEDPVGFVRKKLLAKEKIREKLQGMLAERDKLEHKCNVFIVEETNTIKERISLIPNKIYTLLDRYTYLNVMMAPDGFIMEVFNALNKNNTRMIKLRKLDFWSKSIEARLKFGSLVYNLQQAWKDAWEAKDELAFKKYINQFDLFLARLDQFKYLDEEIDKCSVNVSVTLEQFQELYDKITQWAGEISEIADTISSNVELKKLVWAERRRLVDLNNEQKRLKLKIKDINIPIDEAQKILDGRLYILEVFWRYITLEYEEFSGTVTKLLDFENYNNWQDARKKYEIYLKIKYSLDSHETMFKSLVNAYTQAMSNLRQAKRNYTRYKDRATKITLEKCTLHPVKISMDENADITNLITLCGHMNKINEYVDDTNLFYDENAELAMSMYRDSQLLMNMWTDIFARLMGKVS
jgi:hypothetical protein